MICDLKTEITNGAKLFVDFLITEGVDKIFGYPGATILPVYDELGKTDKITHYLCRHEQAAVHAADGYARVSHKVGVVLVTAGPGATNTITGIINAYSDKIPLVIITGRSEEIGHNNFQEADMQSITSSCSKKHFLINKSEDIIPNLKDAFKLAKTYPMGPVVISVTRSLLNTTFNTVQIDSTYSQTINVEAKQSAIFKLLDNLKTAKKPVILVGGGCKESKQLVHDLIHITNFPVVHTLMAKGIVEDISLGMIGLNGHNIANAIVKESDLLLVLGSKLDSRITGKYQKYLPNTKIININIEENKSSNIEVYQEIQGDLKIILQQILSNIKNNKIMFHLRYDWLDRVDYLKKQFEKDSISISYNKGLETETVLNIIQDYTKRYNPIITTDVGQHQILVSKIFKSNTPYNFLTSGGMGTMGFGFPAAIGANIAKPDSLVLCITGDGSFQMNMQELGTCLEYKIPIKIIIMNNSSLGLIKQAQAKYYDNRYYQSDMINPDFVKIAEAYNIKSASINSIEELKISLNKYISASFPVLFDIHTVNSEQV